MNWFSTAAIPALAALLSCSNASEPPRGVAGGPAPLPSASSDKPAEPQRGGEVPSIEVVSQHEPAPPEADAVPRFALAFRFADGTRTAIDGEATAYVPFRRGVALVDVQNRLVLVTPEGTRSVLAQEVAAPPARGPSGELAYAVRYDASVELHVLQPDGRDRIVASGLGSAGLLAPQADGRLVFIGTRKGGGVAGIWLAEPHLEGARCLTNCDLQTGTPLDSRFVPLPADVSSMTAIAERISGRDEDGAVRSVGGAP